MKNTITLVQPWLSFCLRNVYHNLKIFLKKGLEYFAGNLPCACCIKRDTVKLKVAPVTAISLCYADMLMCIIN